MSGVIIARHHHYINQCKGDMKTYITLTALGNYIDIKELTVGEELILEKDKENQYDDEAIKVMVPTTARKAMYLIPSIPNVKEPT